MRSIPKLIVNWLKNWNGEHTHSKHHDVISQLLPLQG
jgi:hypothetical protein